ncbi:hypothetical protein KGD82_11125 [Nocardiopsis eucommiae]|uniref:Uncharacterized protein n=1 Tax=Nocardiopsis eucommiae TaxID=2831970 RepID=A0A975LBH8_9ACTN|nr:hypothetical protein KGD82_11125 [Nocardiopsis eucommiae]
MNDEPTRTHVRKILLAQKKDAEATLKRMADLEAEGTRIVDTVDGGATVDLRTKQSLLVGDQEGPEEVSQLYRSEVWRHIDHLWEDSDPVHVEATEGIPQSLGHALEDWLGMVATPDEEVTEFVGWSMEEVN